MNPSFDYLRQNILICCDAAKLQIKTNQTMNWINAHWCKSHLSLEYAWSGNWERFLDFYCFAIRRFQFMHYKMKFKTYNCYVILVKEENFTCTVDRMSERAISSQMLFAHSLHFSMYRCELWMRDAMNKTVAFNIE